MRRQTLGVTCFRGLLVSLLRAVVVAEVPSFRHAADVLGVTQSSVSAGIKGLEDALGTMPFKLRHRGVRLTEVGRHFVAEVSAGLDVAFVVGAVNALT